MHRRDSLHKRQSAINAFPRNIDWEWSNNATISENKESGYFQLIRGPYYTLNCPDKCADQILGPTGSSESKHTTNQGAVTSKGLSHFWHTSN